MRGVPAMNLVKSQVHFYTRLQVEIESYSTFIIIKKQEVLLNRMLHSYNLYLNDIKHTKQ